jgi:hypothetical protein
VIDSWPNDERGHEADLWGEVNGVHGNTRGRQPTDDVQHSNSGEIENAINVPQRREKRVVVKGTGDRFGRHESNYQLFDAPCDAVESEFSSQIQEQR